MRARSSESRKRRSQPRRVEEEKDCERKRTFDVVLKRCSSDEKSRSRRERFEGLVQLRFRVLETMSLSRRKGKQERWRKRVSSNLARRSSSTPSLEPKTPTKVFDTHLINLQSLPLDPTQIAPILQDEFVRREQNVELEFLGRSKLVLSDDLSRISFPHVADDVHVGSPVLELLLPGGDGGERDDDEERTVLLSFVEEVVEERDGLDGFS